jgi:hypothetical protein
MNKSEDILDVIENVKIKLNNERKTKNQSIKDYLKECEIESSKLVKNKELVLK